MFQGGGPPLDRAGKFYLAFGIVVWCACMYLLFGPPL